jgi:hypothetical protein
MSAGEPLGPRRGWQPDEDPDDPVASDDTPEAPSSPARRGTLPEDADGGSEGAGPDAGASPTANPFARPGSEAALEAAPPIPVLPLSDTPIPAPVFPRSSGEFADSPSPAPRRSALSSTTPVEAEPVDGAPYWFREHRRTLLAWGIGGLALALVVAVVVSLVVRGGGTTVPPTETPTPSVSETAVPDAAGAADLVTVADLAGVAAGAWAITGTSHTAAEHDGRVACFQTNDDDANPTFSVQRTLATSEKEPVAALHRIDAFANEAVAQMIYEDRLAVLSSCSEIPARLQGANTVVGLAPEAFQITVLFQEENDRYHTILLTRSGAVLQVLDVTQVGTPVNPEALAAALTRPQTQLSERQGQDVPDGVTVSNGELPSVAPAGWLIPSDLPRIRPGVGRWNMKDPAQLTSKGMGCEAMTLASEPGPDERQQATYLMTQDDQMPETFGIDEMRFTFAKKKAAGKFVDKLGDALKSCKDRSLGANVEEQEEVETKTADGKATSRVFVINMETSATESVTYQLIVTQVNTRATYSLITAADDYRFTDEQLADLAARTAIRAAQA